jgi:hypothetical protein
MDRRHVLDRLLAHVPEGQIDHPAYGVAHGAGHADAARGREALEPSRDIDAVAEQVAVALDHVADRQAHAELEPTGGRDRGVQRRDVGLHGDGGPKRLDGRIELAHDRVAGRVEDAAARVPDHAIEDRARSRQQGERLLLGLGDQARISGDVGRQDRGDLALERSPGRSGG